MKIFQMILIGLLLSGMTIVNAETLQANLAQGTPSLDRVLQKGDELVVNYNTERSPLFRSAEWWFYAIRCDANEQAQIQYPFNGQLKKHYLPILLSNSADRQRVGDDIDEKGIFTIKNLSANKLYLDCKLYAKFGN